MRQIVSITITDEDIRHDVETMTADLEEEEWIRFPDDKSRDEFIEDCTECIIDKYEFYDGSDCIYAPDYESEILDLAKWYGY